jgi:hypothetical protein
MQMVIAGVANVGSEKKCAPPPRKLSILIQTPRWTIKRPFDLPMKKAANCMSLAAFVMRYGGGV